MSYEKQSELSIVTFEIHLDYLWLTELKTSYGQLNQKFSNFTI